jgi:hypothetical protein
MDKLSEEEQQLISLFRSTTDRGRAYILICANSAQLYNKQMAGENWEEQSK